ncbi:MAG: NUDIX domain-containing protein [Chloroflexi bacterium]|nr:NUDIX domain-containing protein [Chloroflexota bacterium]
MDERLPERPFAAQGGPVVLAHRGWRGYYPENTLLAFEMASKMPIDGLEIDIHSTADGELVVIHDDTVDRTTNGSGPVKSYTFAELQKLDAGYHWTKDDGKTFPFRGRGITIPTLKEVMERFPHLWINVDIKQAAPSIIESFGTLIRKTDKAAHMCVGSFNGQTVARFRREMPAVAKSGSKNEVRLLFVTSKLRMPGLYRGQANVFQIPEYEGRIHLVTPQFVQAAHKNNVAVHVWTVNETAVMQRLLDIGVDGLVTDYPDRALRLLGRISDNHRRRVSLVFIKDDKILMIRRERMGRTYYVLPGGGVEPGETIAEAAHREAKEETSYNITLGPTLWQDEPIDGNHLDTGYLVKSFNGNLQLGGPELDNQSADNLYFFEWMLIDAVNHVPHYPWNIDTELIQQALKTTP